MEWDGIEKLKRLIGDGIFKSVSDLAIALNEPDGNVRNWLVKGIRPSSTKRFKIDTLLSKYGVNKDAGRQASVERKIGIIADTLEKVVPLMKWFIQDGTENDREYLRSVLGTDLSFDIFYVSRALLTEKHLERTTKEE